MDAVASGLDFEHARRGGAVLRLVEAVAEAFTCLFDLFFYFFFEFGDVFFEQYVGAVALFGVFIVDERVVEGAHVAAGLPGAGVHEDGGVDPHDVFPETRHRLPPVGFDVVLEFDAHLAVVVDG